MVRCSLPKLLSATLLATCGLVAGCTVATPERAAPKISFERRHCDPVPGRLGYCATGILSMERVGYRLVLVSPADPWAVSLSASLP